MVSAIRVSHLSQERGTEVLGAALAIAAAALGIGNPPACGVRAVPALKNGCKGHVEHAQGMSNLKQGLRGVGGALQGIRHGGAAAARRRRARSGYLGCATGETN